MHIKIKGLGFRRAKKLKNKLAGASKMHLQAIHQKNAKLSTESALF